jgi:hypothetical protein
MTDQSPEVAPEREDAVYFPVSATKLVVLSLCSFGLYGLYWFYRQWKLEAARTHEDLSPFWRAVFAPLFANSLFNRIKGFGDEGSLPPAGYSPAFLAVIFWVLNVSWRLPDPAWLLGLFTFLPLLPVRAAVAAINRTYTPKADANARFSGANVALVVIGGLLLILAIIGAFIPAPSE